MLVKNLTPFLFGTKVTSRRPPEPEMTLVVRGRWVLAPGEPLRLPEGPFPLSQGMLSAEVFRDDDDERAGECLYPGDFADYKLSAEVMVKGTCHTPGGKPMKECPVRFSVGAWSKMLRVVGPRVWVESVAGAVPSDPAPFTKMPIGWASALGGPGFSKNPAGKGVGTRELPNVEAAGAPIRSKGSWPDPAGFGPISPYWPQRSEKVGRAYGEAYRRERAPYYAEDFDFDFFSASPPDQRIDGCLRGDEEVVFENLHPSAHALATRLPGVRVRAFVKDATLRVREVGMSLDTLFADLDEGTLTLTWRGVDAVKEHDLSDVSTVLFASEPMAERPEPADKYREILEAFERDPIGLRDHVPEKHRDVWDVLAGKAAPKQDDEDEDEEPDPITALLRQRLGRAGQREQKRVERAIAALRRMPMPPTVNLDKLLAKAVNDVTAKPSPVALAPGATPRAPIGAALRQILARVEEIKKQAAAKGVALPRFEALEALANDPRIRALDPSFRPPSEPEAPLEEPGPGANLAGRDLAGRDLSGVDLTGADLTDAILTGAKLAGAKLAHAKLARAVLFEADLTGADLTSADLTAANLGSARANEAIFRDATLTRAQLGKASLKRAVLTGAKGETPLLGGADLSGADARGADFSRAMADGAILEGADFSGAKLVECRFAGARAARARFEGALLAKASFADAVLEGAVLTGARGAGSIWIRATLTDADLRHALLPDAHFQEARAGGARFACADLREARFYRARLERADLSTANLLGADLRNARIGGATFAGSNLYDAKLLGVSGAGCDFEGANLKRAAVDPR